MTGSTDPGGSSADGEALRRERFRRHMPGTADAERIERDVAVERPIALEFNGIGYAVMMATPGDLDDFAIGFALGERLIESHGDVADIVHHQAPNGEVLRVTIVPARAEALVERARHRVSESSCGLCGIENLDQAMRPLPRVTSTSLAKPEDIFAAVSALHEHQPLNRATGAVHAAACCAPNGRIRLVREDVGRHNAFDKLIGAMARTGVAWDAGFALLSSRCSYELVEKAVLARCPLLVTISAPTSLAIARAKAAGLSLVSLARNDSFLELVTENEL